LNATGKFTPTDKLVGIERIWLQKEAPCPEASPTKLYMPPIAKRIGVGAQVISRSLKKLAAAGIAVHRPVYDQATQHTRTTFAMTMSNTDPIVFADDDHHAKDRKRKRCKDCKSTNLVERVTILCADCGCVQSTHERPMNDKESPILESHIEIIEPIESDPEPANTRLEQGGDVTAQAPGIHLPDLEECISLTRAIGRVYHVGPRTADADDPWTCGCGCRVWKSSSARQGTYCDACGAVFIRPAHWPAPPLLT
jgi:hypothetical protein